MKTQRLATLFILCFTIVPACRGNAQILDALRSFFGGDPLIEALEAGEGDDADLASLLSDLDEEERVVSTSQHAEAIIDLLKQAPLNQETVHWNSAEYELASLFSEIESVDCDAFPILFKQGIPQLIRIYNELKNKGDPERDEDLIYLLLTCAKYQSSEATQLIIEAAQQGIAKEHFLWGRLIALFDGDHRDEKKVLAAFASKLPVAPIDLAFLQVANSRSLKEEGFPHPFSSDIGIAKLEGWLSRSRASDIGAAYSAAVGLAFVRHPKAKELHNVAMKHPSLDVQLEAAWAAGYAGNETGFTKLQELCSNVDTSALARIYLEELEKEALIPDSAKEPIFAAKAEFSNWLQHPNELGEAPDELQIVDQRELTWHDSTEPSTFTIVRYVVESESLLDADDVGVGLVGSMTWSFFSLPMTQLQPEDIYAIHCTWEAESSDLINEIEPSRLLNARLLKQWPNNNLRANVEVILQPIDFEYPQRIVAVAKGSLEDEEGWAVLDGERSRWYPASDFPDEMPTHSIIQIHMGRVALGLPLDTVRTVKREKKNQLTSLQFIKEYERLLDETINNDIDKRIERISGLDSVFERHLERYLQAKSELNKDEATQSFSSVYQRFLDIANSLPSEDFEEHITEDSLIGGENFERFVKDAGPNNPESVRDLLTKVRPLWTEEYGRELIGIGEYYLGNHKQALEHLESVDPEWLGSEGSYLLARLWLLTGKKEQALEFTKMELEYTRRSFLEASDDENAVRAEQLKKEERRLAGLLDEIGNASSDKTVK